MARGSLPWSVYSWKQESVCHKGFTKRIQQNSVGSMPTSIYDIRLKFLNPFLIGMEVDRMPINSVGNPLINRHDLIKNTPNYHWNYSRPHKRGACAEERDGLLAPSMRDKKEGSWALFKMKDEATTVNKREKVEET